MMQFSVDINQLKYIDILQINDNCIMHVRDAFVIIFRSIVL